MLTPEFKINQTEDTILINIRLPYVKITSCQFYIEQFNFKFYLKPYLLNLTFEQPLVQADEPYKATYYHEKHILEVHLNKKNKGEEFKNLNLLSKMLNKKQSSTTKKHTKTLIEVLDEPSLILVNEDVHKNIYAYGFCNNYTKVFQKLQEQCYEIFSLNPEQVSSQDRCKLSRQISQSAFDQQAYLYDKYENQEQIDQILNSEQTITGIKNIISKYTSKQPESYEQFKSNLKIPNKEIIVSKVDQSIIIKQIVSIVFTYLYELICMQGDMSVESAKTINNCSPLFSCCVGFQNFQLPQIIRDCSKRCFSYSLYKNVKVCQEAIKLLVKYLDQTFVCAVLSNLRNMFQKSQPRYLLNTIFLNDYLIYCFKQNISSQLIQIKKELKNIDCTQQFLDLKLQQQEDEDENEEKQNEKQRNETKPKNLIQEIQQKESSKDQLNDTI